ncbi:MAG: hypothetical protein K6A65_00395 [Succinivibrionaceae bacterium]|nr:hypothetical protein [Succinivibrionaceae bacterium]
MRGKLGAAVLLLWAGAALPALPEIGEVTLEKCHDETLRAAIIAALRGHEAKSTQELEGIERYVRECRVLLGK